MIDWTEVDALIEKGYISCRKHPTENLYIYNYTHKCQFDGEWNHETMTCRGLIADHNRNILARPFRKFFSLDQLVGLRNKFHYLYGFRYKEINGLKFRAYEKCDGSLGVSYHINDKLYLASRGSFDSEQALKANQIWQEKYSHIALEPSYTYLFEIIYPENRIVVDYGDMEDLILLAVVDTASGKELHREDWPCVDGLTLVDHHEDISSLEQLEFLNNDSRFDGKEGVVLLFENGFRVKFKLDNYKTMHKLLSDFSRKNIYELIINGGYNDYAQALPDEFYDEAERYKKDFEDRYNELLATIALHYQKILLRKWNGQLKSRKDIAIFMKEKGFEQTYQAAIFSLLDHKPITKLIHSKIIEGLKDEKTDIAYRD